MYKVIEKTSGFLVGIMPVDAGSKKELEKSGFLLVKVEK